jgi:alpha-tubulin suppressor-like RCC1 family protein
LWCWGYGGLGGLGDNSITNRSSPVQTVAFGTNWMQVSVGSNYTTCIKTDGTLWTWGSNATYGQLGDNTVAPKSSPVQTVAFGTNWKQVSAGNGTTTCIKTDGTLWCWGYGGTGLLGDNTNANKSSPVQTVTGGNNWKQVSCFNYTTAIKTDGTLWCWGGNSDGGLGDNTTTTRSSPVQTIMYGTNWNQVSGGFYQAAAIQYQDDYQ